MKKILLFALTASLAAPAFASNFPYSNIDVAIGKMRLDEDFVFAGEVYEEFGTFSLSGAYQFNSNFALGLGTSAFANEGPATEIVGVAVALTAMFPFAVGDQLDIVPSVGLQSSELERCRHNWCYSDSDSGLSYGLGLRAWIVPNELEITAGITDSTLEDSEPLVSVGGALWWLNQHSFRLNYSSDKDTSQVSLGYRYSF